MSGPSGRDPAATAARRVARRGGAREGRLPLISELRLGNGVRVLLEPMARVRTASVGLWFLAGSRDDPPQAPGLAHLLEHLVFKGGHRLGARRLAEAMDALGGQFNAFTTREHTCFHARTLGDRLDEAIGLMAEMVVAPRLDPAEVERERLVVLDELAMIADDPAETADELFSSALWGDDPLGRPLAGTSQSVRAMDAAALRAFHVARYVGPRCVVAVAGRFDADRLLPALEGALGGLPVEGAPSRRPVPEARPRPIRQVRRSQQAHLVCGLRGPAEVEPDRFTAALFASVLGGSPSSRLFQALREERGLCYDVGAGLSEYADAGELSLYLAATPGSARSAVSLALAEVRRLAATGPDAAELRRHQDQLVASAHIGLEGTEPRMLRLGRLGVAGLPLQPLSQVVAAIRRVSVRRVRDFAASLGDPGTWAAAYVGPRNAVPGPWAWEEEPAACPAG